MLGSKHLRLISGLVMMFSAMATFAAEGPSEQWRHYGGDLAGSRYAAEVNITPENIKNLKQAWVFRTGDVAEGDGYFGSVSSFKATAIYVANKLIVSSGFNRVYAVDPASGDLLWSFEPDVSFDIQYAEMFTSRGVSAWSDEDASSGECATRIFLGTLDAKLHAIDAGNGQLCTNFGEGGHIDLSKGVRNYRRGQYSVTTPPTVVNNAVIVGSSVGDNGKTNLDSGVVRGFDARSGELLWQWDPIPRSRDRAEVETWEKRSWRRTGGANVWSSMAADPERNLVYLPTTSPSPDFYGGKRLGDNAYANSIVALNVDSGEVQWAYQTIRHDLWDYDLAAQPLLADVDIRGEAVPALVMASKTGFVFMLNRETGEVLFDVQERAVPVSDVKGEVAAVTQKFPALRLHPEPKSLPEIFQYSSEHVASCEQQLEGVRYEGIFTPPSLSGTLLYPGNPGGVNWGSMSVHKPSQTAFAVVNRLATFVQLLKRRDFNRMRRSGTHRGRTAQYTEQDGTPYGMVRFELINSYAEGSVPCFEGPWSTLIAIDLAAGEVSWEAPLGVAPAVQDDPIASTWGSPVNYGGSIVTKGGVVMVASRADGVLRALSVQSGEELWTSRLPAQVQATPMAYVHEGESYVAIAVGGDDGDGGRGDYLVAFKM